MNRREFLKGTAWMGAAAVAAGCACDKVLAGTGGSMQGFACKPLKRIRVGVVGCGSRGRGAIHRLAIIPGVEVAALCDLHQVRLDEHRQWLKENKKPIPREYVGPEAYKALCESEVDAVYVCTGWTMHTPVALYALEHGKHAFIEVPSATTLDECWALVETAERTRLHCMQLENACYCEAEMLCLNLVRQGLLGELVHCEGAYIHDLRIANYADWTPKDIGAPYVDYWRLKANVAHKGNQYETHGLGPLCQYLNINRGDRFEYLTSMESDQTNFEAYARAVFPSDSWKAKLKVAMGDMNTTVIRTAKGRTVLVQHDISSPRPYSRLNVCTGTKGIFSGITLVDTPEQAFAEGNPARFGWEEKPGEGVHKFFDFTKYKEIRERYRHPLWRDVGAIAKKVGGHGGCDFLMDLRWCYCLQNGLPLDQDVYDLAAWDSLGELTERSVRSRSQSVEVPDFTRGGWKTAKPLGIVEIDPKKMGLGDAALKEDRAQLSV